MKQQRMRWLVIMLVALGITRWWLPLNSDDFVPAVVSAVVVRSGGVAPSTTAVVAHLDRPASMAAKMPIEEAAGNAFAVRSPAPLPIQITPPALSLAGVTPVAVSAEVSPVPTAQELAPPLLQVIGTWNNATGFAVFVSSPNGTLIAKPGGVLMSEYAVTDLTPQFLSLRQLSSQRDFQLPVPRAPGS